MKSYVKLLLLVILVTGFASCGLLDVEVDSTFKANLEIEVDEPVTKSAEDGVAFFATETIIADDNEEVEEYGHLIETVDVTDIMAVVAVVTQTDDLDVVFLAGSTFTIEQGGTSASWTMETDWPIEVGTTFDM